MCRSTFSCSVIFKQFPPATCRPPFIVAPSVRAHFRFAVLRENRRVVQGGMERAPEIENFHHVLADIADGVPTDRVRQFITNAYGKGALVTAKTVDYEGSTSIFTKRRYRDAWNRPILLRLAKASRHSMKIQARCRHVYAKDQRWCHERREKAIRRRVRAQAPWTLHLAGDWIRDALPMGAKRHLMRAMLVSNVDVPQRFANGTQGRVMYWHPGFVDKGKKLLASHPELLVRFVKEAAYQSEQELVGEVHFMDVPARAEDLKGTNNDNVIANG